MCVWCVCMYMCIVYAYVCNMYMHICVCMCICVYRTEEALGSIAQTLSSSDFQTGSLTGVKLPGKGRLAEAFEDPPVSASAALG